MESNEIGLEKVEKMDIKKSIDGFKTQPSYGAYEPQAGYCPKHVPTGTEKHHVSHVLTFFSFMAYNAKRGTGVKAHLLDRAIHHLAALREFVEDPAVSELVTSLYESARLEHKKFPKDGERRSGLIRAWLSKQQGEILKLAGHYQKGSVFDGLLPIPVSIGIKKSAGTAIRDLPRPRSKNSMVGGTGPDNLRFLYRDQGLQERNFVMDERKIGQLFTGYFNNKMTLLLFLIQAKKVKPNPVLVGTVHSFLDDMFRHMFEGSMQKRYRRIFKWLKLFFEKLPDVSVYQRDRAKEFIRAIYDAFGLHLKSDI